MKHLTVIVKPTNRCNAHCLYCSAWEPGHARDTMSEETLTVLFERIEEWVARSKRTRSIKIIWHGGEPTLMPAAFFKTAVQLQTALKNKYKLNIENNMQSNLLHLDEEKLEVLGQLLSYQGKKRTVGTSYDPIPGIRVLKNKDYTAEWERGIRLLKKHGFPFGIVYVVHRRTIENLETVTDVFLKKYGKIGIRFNPLYKEGRASDTECLPLYITAKEWGRFLVRLYRVWEAGGKKPNWQPLKEIDDFHFSKDTRMTCDHSGKCGTTHLGIGTSGSVYSCGRGIDRNHQAYGNIREHSISDILKHPARLEMTNRSAYLHNTHCFGCRWWQYCHGGCPMDAAINHDNDIFKKTNFCPSRRTFLESVYKEPRH
jgi:uncharacterized protein